MPLIGSRLSSRAHRVDRGLVGSLLVAAAAQPRGRDRRALGDADEFHGEDAVEAGDDAVFRHVNVPVEIDRPEPGGALFLSKRCDNSKTGRAGNSTANRHQSINICSGARWVEI